MEKFVITGGKPLHGEVTISGAKNAAVGILPATILAADVCVIENLPDISDVSVSLKILSTLGAQVKMLNRIPMSRGLGSSSSAIVAGLFAANALCDDHYTKDELLDIATEIEGHPDNVAPALYGGFTISYMEQEKAHSLRLLPAKPLKFIAVVPDSKLPTSLARQAIPKTVPHKDAVYNTSRASLLVGALLSGNYEYLGMALDDKLHQPYRAHLIPGLPDVFAAAKEAGAYNAIISGAGSTVMAYASPEAECERIAKAMVDVFAANNEHACYHILDLDTDGVKKV